MNLFNRLFRKWGGEGAESRPTLFHPETLQEQAGRGLRKTEVIVNRLEWLFSTDPSQIAIEHPQSHQALQATQKALRELEITAAKVIRQHDLYLDQVYAILEKLRVMENTISHGPWNPRYPPR